uniref:Uncharacterized protein n=1 Tax=Kalanchoe fedtschenkoi TaxID=63787 RepID=A0A7N0SXS1_KALFE
MLSELDLVLRCGLLPAPEHVVSIQKKRHGVKMFSETNYRAFFENIKTQPITSGLGAPDATRSCKSRTNLITNEFVDFAISTSFAVTIAFTCFKLTTITLSLPKIVDGYDRMGSSTLRSRAGSLVQAIIVCFPTSSRRWPDSVITSHDRDTATIRPQTQVRGD